MLGRVIGTMRWVAAEFGPLVVFWVLYAAFGIRVAIAGSILFILADGLWRWWRGLEFTRLYLLISGMTLVFGAIDLLSATPFMLKYEAVVTNIVTGLMFVAGARGPRPLVQEVVEQRRGESFAGRPDFIRFFQIFTLIWAAYFFIKAGFYFAVGEMLPMTQAMALRSVVGGASLALMTALSFSQGRRLFFLCRRLGLLPAAAEAPK